MERFEAIHHEWRACAGAIMDWKTGKLAPYATIWSARDAASICNNYPSYFDELHTFDAPPALRFRMACRKALEANT